MTVKHRKFVTEYIKDGNAAQAAIRSGYAPKHARKSGHRLLTRPEVRAAVEAARRPALKKSQISLESHLEELARLRDKAIAKGQLSAAVRAEECRGKVAGLYVERHAGPDGKGPVEVRIVRTIVRPVAES
jgi:phage terminase small subunit